MKPYYQDDAVTLYHGDCREILPHVTADVLVTDPPYGVSFKGKATKSRRPSGGYLGVDDAEIGPLVVAMALESIERGAVFTGNRLLHDYPKPRDIGCVYCPCGAGLGPWGFTCFHPVLFYGSRPGGPGSPSSISSFDTADDPGHPCPKPMPWMRWAVALTSREGETILDPFCGSGTTLRAAKDLGRKAIGIEIEEKYCRIAADRCAQETLALTSDVIQSRHEMEGRQIALLGEGL